MFLSKADSADSDEMLHLIWVFTVFQGTCLGVSSIKRVDVFFLVD